MISISSSSVEMTNHNLISRSKEIHTVVETSILGIRSHAACNEMTPSHVCAHVKYKYETSKEEDLLSFFPYLTGH